MPGRRKKPCVADETEVAAYFTGVMRGEPTADEKLPGVKEQLKAAELLGKHFGMFAQKEKEEGLAVNCFLIWFL